MVGCTDSQTRCHHAGSAKAPSIELGRRVYERPIESICAKNLALSTRTYRSGSLFASRRVHNGRQHLGSVCIRRGCFSYSIAFYLRDALEIVALGPFPRQMRWFEPETLLREAEEPAFHEFNRCSELKNTEEPFTCVSEPRRRRL